MLTASYNCPCPRIISISDDVGFAIFQDLKIMNHNPLNLLRQSISNILQRFVILSRKLQNLIGNDLSTASFLFLMTVENVLTNSSLSRYDKVSRFMSKIQRSLSVDNNPEIIVLLYLPCA